MQVCFYLLLVLHVAEGCTLKDNQQTKYITAYTGGSVLLPCSCTDLHTKPETFKWRKYITNRDTWEEISSESGQYRNRVQLVNGHSPGNLSLLISHLTEQEGGMYQCDSGSNQYIYIILTVKGCTLVNSAEMLPITAHTGGSVLLPCYCTDLHNTHERVTWKKYSKNRDTWQEIDSESGQYRNRVQLVNDHHPALFLLISHLTEEDGGDYRCGVMNSGSTYIRLTVEAASSPSTMDSKFFIYAAVGGLLLLMVLSGVIYWRCRAQRRGQMEGCERKKELRRDQETQNDCEVLYATVNKEDKCKKVQETDDVTYCTVVHSNTSAPATNPMDTGLDTAEYASVKLN